MDEKDGVSKQAVVTGSLIIEEDKKYYNRLIWMRPDGSLITHDKRHLFRTCGEETNIHGRKTPMDHVVAGWKIFPWFVMTSAFRVVEKKKGMIYDCCSMSQTGLNPE